MYVSACHETDYYYPKKIDSSVPVNLSVQHLDVRTCVAGFRIQDSGFRIQDQGIELSFDSTTNGLTTNRLVYFTPFLPLFSQKLILSFGQFFFVHF